MRQEIHALTFVDGNAKLRIRFSTGRPNRTYLSPIFAIVCDWNPLFIKLGLSALQQCFAINEERQAIFNAAGSRILFSALPSSYTYLVEWSNFTVYIIYLFVGPCFPRLICTKGTPRKFPIPMREWYGQRLVDGEFRQSWRALLSTTEISD